MDHGSFDRLTRILGGVGSRRAALGALVAGGMAGTGREVAAKKRRSAKGSVTAQATCDTPESGANLSNCDFTGADFANDDLHGSSMRATIFKDADLREADLHGSNAKGANFRGANLCKTRLYSSTLASADFSGANLRGADLHSSGCTGIVFNGPTKFCNTVLCDGTVDDSDCAKDPLGQGLCCFDSECTVPAVCGPDKNRCCWPTGTPSIKASFCCSGVLLAGFCA
ncbi:MAG: pentapeptide repeat-containing protein [Thermomicrobiales bacterium]